MRIILNILAILGFALAGLSFLGGFHPAFDSLAVLRPLFLVAAFFFLFAWRGKWRLLGAALFALMLVPFAGLIPRGNENLEAELRLYQHNLLYTNTAPDLQLISDQLAPDVLTLQEVNLAMRKLQAFADYPFQQTCSKRGYGEVVVASRTEFLDAGCSNVDTREFAWARIKTKTGREVTIVSMHLYWPYPYSQGMQLESWWPQIAKLPKPIIIAGDFNQVPWSFAVRETAKQAEGKIASGLRNTLTLTYKGFVMGPVLPIDHIIIPKGTDAYIRKLNRYGSDHNALLLDWAGE